MKSPYEVKTSDEDEEGGEAPSNDDKSSNSKSDSSSNDSSSDSGNDEDDSTSDSESKNNEGYDRQYIGNDWGQPLSDRKDEDVGPFYENYSDNDVDYYDGDIEDDVEAKLADMENGIESEEYELENELETIGEEIEEADNIDYDDYPYKRPLDWTCIIDGSSRLGPRYDKHGREIPELRSFHNSKLAH